MLRRQFRVTHRHGDGGGGKGGGGGEGGGGGCVSNLVEAVERHPLIFRRLLRHRTHLGPCAGLRNTPPDQPLSPQGVKVREYEPRAVVGVEGKHDKDGPKEKPEKYEEVGLGGAGHRPLVHHLRKQLGHGPLRAQIVHLVVRVRLQLSHEQVVLDLHVLQPQQLRLLRQLLLCRLARRRRVGVVEEHLVGVLPARHLQHVAPRRQRVVRVFRRLQQLEVVCDGGDGGRRLGRHQRGAREGPRPLHVRLALDLYDGAEGSLGVLGKLGKRVRDRRRRRGGGQCGGGGLRRGVGAAAAVIEKHPTSPKAFDAAAAAADVRRMV
mmetsp:Transcript_36526/g.90127  ORF Transcript_36526/g.90127 Transcript_36526/m.90127 type:complete len:321 (-) Transcript_36526:337-1299(-)